MEEKGKNKAKGCIKNALIIIGAFFVITTIIGIVAAMFSGDDDDYSVRKEEVNATKVKTTVEIVLPRKESKEKIAEISRHFRDKHKTKNVLIHFYLTNTQKHNYAYAGWHDDKFDGVSINQPIYGDTDWFIDPLQAPKTEIIGVWGDTLEVSYIVGIVKQGNEIVLKSATLEGKYLLPDEIIQLKNNIYYNKDNPKDHQSYIVTSDNKLEVYYQFYNINGEIQGGELAETLPPLMKAAN